ncbi:fasciclin domain-containing protein [Acanthopleuribacter pedis]|uniref:Fasciclin domain-containing protein n=1 Tax=Acanthopleuribacter pedis TaxID=442870 RepID=A0A8J7U1E2_9BACT|nr:fasciclin domain-containing protein [Acanthopleuribacter pedis]MBO1317432.1 fasciclin domain-containing protein [Acanthopleuribacter pedis]
MRMFLFLSLASLFLSAPSLEAQCGSKKTAHQAYKQHTERQTVAYHDNHRTHRPDLVETALANGNFKTLTTALGSAGLVSALQAKGPFTVFAPSDAAFDKLPAGTVQSLLRPENREALTAILTYHVVKGAYNAERVTRQSGAATLNGQRLPFDTASGVRVGRASVVQADIHTANGIIHVIDEVLLPSDQNLVQVAAGTGDFETLIAAAKAAQLDGLLANQGPFTVFAPTDDAFAKLPKGTVQNLLKPENRNQLAEILKYHVVKGRVFADEAVGVGSAHAVNGDDLQFRLREGRLNVNQAKIVASDVQAQNGVIHIIDRVLLPN